MVMMTVCYCRRLHMMVGLKKNNVYTMDYNMGKLPPKRLLSVDAGDLANGASPMTASFLKIAQHLLVGVDKAEQ